MIGDGGTLYQGTVPGIDRPAFEAAMAEKTVAQTLNRFETKDGDFFFLPARTVHALGTGLPPNGGAAKLRHYLSR